MQRTYCEKIIWKGIPGIRKEIAVCMIKNFGLSQIEAAEILGVTPAAICQYLHEKRGNIKIKDEKIMKEIKISAEKIIKNQGDSVVSETCRVCKILRSNGMFFFLTDTS